MTGNGEGSTMIKKDFPEYSAHLKVTYKPEVDAIAVDVSAVHHLFAPFLHQEKSPEPIISDNPGTTSPLKSRLPADPEHTWAAQPGPTGNRDKLRGRSINQTFPSVDLERLTTVAVSNENLSGASM
jgi:hypothetical protein